MTDTRDRPTLLAATPPDDYSSTPHDYDAERDVLAGILQNPATLDDVTLLLTAEDFYHPGHELIYAAILALYSRTRPVDITTVANQLAADLDRGGGRATLEQLHFRGLGIISPDYHAEIVADLSARRRLDAIAIRIRQLARAERGHHDRAATIDLLETAEAEIHAIPRGVPGVDLADTNSWAPVELAHIIEAGETLEQPTLLARTDGQNLLYPAAVHSISGEPETGKTWAALIAAAQILRDEDAALHVTYVDFEDRAGRVIPRLIHLGAPRHAIVDRFHYIRPGEALTPSGRKHLDRAGARSALVVIDGVTEAMTMHGLKLEDNADAARYLDLLPRHLADLAGASVLQVDHVIKDADNRGRYAIGAQHKLAGLDGVSYGVKIMQPFGRGKIGRAAISVHKDRPGAIREVALGNSIAHLVIDSRNDAMTAYLEEPQAMPKGPEGGLRPTHYMEQVSRFVETSPGASRKQIEDGIQGKAMWKRQAIDALVTEGYLTVTAGLRGAQCHSVVAVYREGDDDAT